MLQALLRQYKSLIKKDKELFVFFISCAFLVALIGVGSLAQLLALVFFYVLAVWRVTGSIIGALYAGLLISLPIRKGQTFTFSLGEQLLALGTNTDLMVYFTATVSDLCAALLVFVSIRNFVYKKKHGSLVKGPIIILFSFIVVAVLSALLSVRPDVSSVATFQIIRFFMFFILPSLVFVKSARLLFSVITPLVCFQGFWAVAQMINQGYVGRFIESPKIGSVYGKVAWEAPSLLRASGTFVDPDLLGTFLFVHVLLIGVHLLTQKQKTDVLNNFYRVAIIVGCIGIVFTGNRGLYGLLLLGGIWLALYKRATLAKTWRILSMQAKGLIVVMMTVCGSYILARMENFFAIFGSSGSGTFRIQMAQSQILLGLNYLFGIGPGLSPLFFLNTINSEQIFGTSIPHNLLLQIFAETGIVGLLLFIVFLYSVYRLILVRKNISVGLPWIASASGYFLCAMLYPLFLSVPEVALYCFLYLGVAFKYFENETINNYSVV